VPLTATSLWWAGAAGQTAPTREGSGTGVEAAGAAHVVAPARLITHIIRTVLAYVLTAAAIYICALAAGEALAAWALPAITIR
jgi:hypothetical protein